jgi:hypothetical protein
MGPSARHTLAVLAIVLAGFAGAACSSDDDSSTSATTAPSATCTDLQRVQDDVDALTGTNIVQDGTDALESNLDNLRDSVSDLADSATGDLKTQADALRSSVDALSSIADDAGDQPVTSTLSQISDQLQTIGSDLTNLLDSAEENLSNCDTADAGGS